MEAGISSHVWSIVEIVALLDAADKKSGLAAKLAELEASHGMATI
jgi:hypothetical protein